MSNVSSGGQKKSAAETAKAASASPYKQPGDDIVALSAEEIAKLKEQIAQKVAEVGEKLQDRQSDIVGYWDDELSPLYCKPMHVKLFDGQIEPAKPSALASVIALAPALVYTGSKEQGTKKTFLCKTGDVVGIWMKPGMRDMINCAGVPTTITYTGTKKVHKKPGMNPMKVYKVKADGGTRIPVEEDRRQKSAHVPTIFDVRKPKGAESPPRSVDEDTSVAEDEDIPF